MRDDIMFTLLGVGIVLITALLLVVLFLWLPEYIFRVRLTHALKKGKAATARRDALYEALATGKTTDELHMLLSTELPQQMTEANEQDDEESFDDLMYVYRRLRLYVEAESR